MIIQFNLLPDVKKEYIKTRRVKRLIMSVAVLASTASLGVVVLLFLFVQVAQTKNIDDLSEDINREIASINATPEIDKILTVQQQTNTLPGLHEENPYTSRLFDYLFVTTPTTVRISSITLSTVDSAIKIEGSADSLAAVNQYVDTLKFATFTAEGIEDGEPFTDIVADLGRSEERAFYEVSMTYDPILFNNTEAVQLIVPNQVTTRSSIGAPSVDLFEAAPSGGAQ